MLTINKPGIYRDFPTADYFKDPCPQPSLTQSIVKVLLDRSPAHARLEHPRLAPPAAEDDEAPERYDAAKAIGNAAHAVLIGRGKSIAVADFKSWQTKDAKAFKEEAILSGREPILTKHMARSYALVKAATDQLNAAGWNDAFVNGNGEVMIAWQEDGLWFRSLIDWMVTPREVYDLKTSGICLAPHGIGRVAADAGWDIQAAMHERGLDAIDPEGAGRRRFRFVAIENEPPYALTPVEMSETWLTMGRKKLAVAIDIWRRCLDSGRWPAYPTRAVTPDYPGFIESKWLDRETTEFSNLLLAG